MAQRLPRRKRLRRPPTRKPRRRRPTRHPRPRRADVAKGEIVERVVEDAGREIGDNPDDVEVTIAAPAPGEVLAEARTAKGGMGRVIGRRGRAARAIRTVATAAADEEGVTAQVEFVD